MKTEKGLSLLLLLCGHALVGAELRGTNTEKGDHERALQTASCSANPACVALFGGANDVPSGAMCCPPPGTNANMDCCAGTTPTAPDDSRTDTPVTTPTGTIPLPPSTVPAPTNTETAASCLLYPACVALFGGADNVIPGSMCCPPPGTNANMGCCAGV